MWTDEERPARGEVDSLAVQADDDLARPPGAEPERAAVERLLLSPLQCAAVQRPRPGDAGPHLHPRASTGGAHDEVRAACARPGGALRGRRREPGHLLRLGPA